jgi:hypothetical protein
MNLFIMFITSFMMGRFLCKFLPGFLSIIKNFIYDLKRKHRDKHYDYVQTYFQSDNGNSSLGYEYIKRSNIK